MEDVQAPAPVAESTPDYTLTDVVHRLDSLGQQMDWLCTKLQSLFVFVDHMGSSGGGIRGLMSALKQGVPQVTTVDTVTDNTSNVGS